MPSFKKKTVKSRARMPRPSDTVRMNGLKKQPKSATNPAGKESEPGRPSAHETKQYQAKKPEPLPQNSFISELVNEAMAQLGNNTRLAASAFNTLEENAEVYLERYFEDADLVALCRDKRRVQMSDMPMAGLTKETGLEELLEFLELESESA